jgi:hypothetical protein
MSILCQYISTCFSIILCKKCIRHPITAAFCRCYTFLHCWLQALKTTPLDVFLIGLHVSHDKNSETIHMQK